MAPGQMQPPGLFAHPLEAAMLPGGPQAHYAHTGGAEAAGERAGKGVLPPVQLASGKGKMSRSAPPGVTAGGPRHALQQPAGEPGPAPAMWAPACLPPFGAYAFPQGMQGMQYPMQAFPGVMMPGAAGGMPPGYGGGGPTGAAVASAVSQRADAVAAQQEQRLKQLDRALGQQGGGGAKQRQADGRPVFRVF
jgi:hypothetical protein